MSPAFTATPLSRAGATSFAPLVAPAGSWAVPSSFPRRWWTGSLIAQGLADLRDRGLAEARLELSSANAAALALYRSMGYEIVREQVFLAREGGR